ncbi:MAG TPA: family 10 glycosylhydrolase [Longimicrobium sp.]
MIQGGRRSAARRWTAAVAAALAGACTPPARPAPAPPPAPVVQAPAASPAAEAGEQAPPLPREFRGVWVATVANIDWPSAPGLPVEQQRAELLALLDRSAAMNMNAIILQVRTAGDALYPSRLEPWSEYLTGQAGRPPQPAWDPLAFAVEESHRRGMELHAWFNPYRARHPSAKTPLPPGHIGRDRPELVRRYGTHLWMDPGEPAVRAHSLAVVMDVVRRYDVDGVHIDDYFYPYPENDAAGRPIDFPDEPSWRRYQASGGQLARNDWRRENVNGFVREMYRQVKAAKPWVKVGISPFGVYRPNHPVGIAPRGFDQYEKLYADALLWYRQGWMDYFTPQLYWPISRPDLSYPVLLRWWAEQNVTRRHLWPGNFTSRTFEGAPVPWRADEITNQIWATRGQAGATGNVHFSAKAFRPTLNRDSLFEKLLAGPYREPALVPASPWLGTETLPAPALTLRQSSPENVTTVEIAPRGTEPRWWAVQARRGTEWSTRVISGAARSYTFSTPADSVPPEAVVVSPIDRVGNQGQPASVRRDPATR